MKRPFAVGDHVVYRKQKRSVHPTPRARDVMPSRGGDEYLYRVDKYWTVSRVLDGDAIEAVTRRGKTHRLSARDPRLVRAGWFAELLHGREFPLVDLPDNDGSRDRSPSTGTGND